MKNNEKTLSVQKSAQYIGVSKQTIRNWCNKNKIQYFKTPSGQRRIHKSQLQTIINDISTLEKKENYIYARVSSEKQNNDLQRQISILKYNYPDYKLVTDCDSGINFKRKGLRTILESAMQGNLNNVVVAHRDRLSRFGFELIQWIIESNNGKLTVLDQKSEESGNEELANDLLSIIHVFNCRQMGKRRYKIKNKNDKIVSNKETKTDP